MRIDVDKADFVSQSGKAASLFYQADVFDTYAICEFEVAVGDDNASTISNARAQIDAEREKLGLSHCRDGRSKVLEYLARHSPAHFDVVRRSKRGVDTQQTATGSGLVRDDDIGARDLDSQTVADGISTAAERNSSYTPTVDAVSDDDQADWTSGALYSGSLGEEGNASPSHENDTRPYNLAQETEHFTDDIRARLANILGRRFGGQQRGQHNTPVFGAADYTHQASASARDAYVTNGGSDSGEFR